MKNKNAKYVVVRIDRIGMQLYSIINAIYYCEKHNLRYIHIPLDDSNVEYSKLFQLGEGYNTMTKEEFALEHNDRNTKIVNLARLFSLIKNNKNHKKSYINYKSIAFVKYRCLLINKYKKSELYIPLYKNKEINISVHYRRGDVVPYKTKQKNIRLRAIERHNLRYTPDNYINEILNKLNLNMNGIPINIHIHSDSKLELEKIITVKHKFKICPHFNDSTIDSLNSMIQSDILFRYGISSFSGIAAFYNENIVISNIQTKYKYLYNYTNTYMFERCDDILLMLSKKIKMNYIM